MTADTRTPDAIRVAIVLEVSEDNPDLLLIWAGLRATDVVQELWDRGVVADVISIDIDGHTHFSW